MAISSYGVTLKYGEKTSSGTQSYGTTLDIKDFPDLFGEPNLLETTTLSDGAQTFIPGIKQMEMLSFTMNYDKTKAAAIKTQESDGKTYCYKLTFKDGSAANDGEFTWEGQHTLGIAGKGVDEVIEMAINIVPSTEIKLA